MMDIEKLRPYENNARKHSKKQIELIASSIEQYGFNNPILINKDNMIIAGHGRYEAAKFLGLKEVPVIVLDHLSKKKQREYILADNRIAELAEWDMELLSDELAELDIDLGEIGFDHAFFTKAHVKGIKDTPIDKKYNVVISFEDKTDRDKFYEEIEQQGYSCKKT